MHDTIKLPDHYALVSPQDFSDRMHDYWTKPRSDGGLEQCSSTALRTLWKIMGDNFQISIIETAKGVQSPWRILQPPTGTGKTQPTGAVPLSEIQHDLGIGKAGLKKLRETLNNKIHETTKGAKCPMFSTSRASAEAARATS
jgi:hypothetical protein